MEMIKEAYETYMKSEERKGALEKAPEEYTMDADGNLIPLSGEKSDTGSMPD